jgi:hypothetical protein
MRRAVGVAFHRDGWHADDRRFGKAFFQHVIFRLPCARPKRLTVILRRAQQNLPSVSGALFLDR